MLFLTVLFVSGIVSASVPGFDVSDANKRRINQGNGLSFVTKYLEDVNDSLGVEDLVKPDKEWALVEAEVFNKGFSRSTWWLKLDVTNRSEREDFILELAYPPIDQIDLYYQDKYGQIELLASLGDHRPFENRPLKHRNYLVPLILLPKQENIVYLRVRTSGSVQVPIILWTADELLAAESDFSLSYGLYFGALAILGFFNLLLYFFTREKLQLPYVGYVFSTLFFAFTILGFTNRYFPSLDVKVVEKLTLIFGNALILFGSLFIIQFLSETRRNKTLVFQSKFWMVISVTFFIAYMVFPYEFSVRLLTLFSILACIWALSTTIYAWQYGALAANLYAFSWLFLLLGGISLAMSKAEILPRNMITDNAFIIGSLLEIVFLSFALAQKMGFQRSQSVALQKLILDEQVKTNCELEYRVMERTRELERANEELQRLNSIDALTGLKNRGYLDAYLSEEIEKCNRLGLPISLLFIDIDHFKSINDRFGHGFGDHCLVEVARFLDSMMRSDVDVCARYGGEEFCLVLPVTDLTNAKKVAERVRKGIENIKLVDPDTQHEVMITVSIGVFGCESNQCCSVEQYYSKADTALYEAKRNGRNRVELARAIA